jgi:hypothetical protein
MTRSAIFVLCAVSLGFALGGCGLEKIANYRSTERSIITNGWVKPRVYFAEPIYCYRTLSTPMCYDEPREGEESRVVGYFGPRAY